MGLSARTIPVYFTNLQALVKTDRLLAYSGGVTDPIQLHFLWRPWERIVRLFSWSDPPVRHMAFSWPYREWFIFTMIPLVKTDRVLFTLKVKTHRRQNSHEGKNIPHNRETKGSFEFKSYGLEMAYLAVHGQNRPPDGQNSPLGFCTNPPGQKMPLAIIIALGLSGNTKAPLTLTKDA